MTHSIGRRNHAGLAFAVHVCAISALLLGVDGYSLPLSSDPTNVRNQWNLPVVFGKVKIPGASVTAFNVEQPVFYSPLQPVDAYSQDFSEEHGHSGYESVMDPRSRPLSLLSLASSSPSPLSTGRVWRSNNLNRNTNSFRKDSNRRSGLFSRGTPALSMANYMQNGGPGNGNNRNNYNNNRDYNNNNSYNRDNYDYDDRNRGRRGSYDDDRYGPPQSVSQPRGNNRFNTVGSVGSVGDSNASRDGRSMQFQNRRDSNIAGRSGRMMDDPNYRQFSPDSNSRFESRRPNDKYSTGGYRQDTRTGHWTDPNSNYNVNESQRPTHSSDNRYTSDNRYSSPPSSSFTPVPPGDYVTSSAVRGVSQRGPVGAGGNVPYDNAYYNNNDYIDNYESREYEDYESDYYSRNGNIMDNRRGSRGDQRSMGGPGMDDNYYNVGYENSNRRLDRGGGLMRYRPNNQRSDGGYYGNGYDYEVPGDDDYYDSSGSFYNNEGKRVRRFDPYSDRSEGYYNKNNLSNDSTDPDRMVQNQRRRDGRDVQNGAHLRRYDPEWDGRQGLYDEASLYGSDVKGTRSYANGYGGDSMDNRVVGRRGRRRGNSEDPSVLSGGWGETGGRSRSPMSSTSDHMDDRRQTDFNYQQDRSRYDYEGYDRGGRGAPRRGLGRRDVDNERDYYRAGDYRGPDLRGDDSMERFRQGKDVKKTDLYGFETANTPSSKKRITRRKSGNRGSANRRQRNGDDMRVGRTVNGSYNAPPNRGRRNDGGGRINGSAGRDRGLSLDDLNEML